MWVFTPKAIFWMLKIKFCSKPTNFGMDLGTNTAAYFFHFYNVIRSCPFFIYQKNFFFEVWVWLLLYVDFSFCFINRFFLSNFWSTRNKAPIKIQQLLFTKNKNKIQELVQFQNTVLTREQIFYCRLVP